MDAFLTVNGGTQTAADSRRRSSAAKSDEQRLSLQYVNGFEDRVFEGKDRPTRGQGQGQDRRILSSSCPQVRGQSSITPPLILIKYYKT